MPNTREKLIKIIADNPNCFDLGFKSCDECVYGSCEDCYTEALIDCLIANGVTIQKWIPVSERLPEGMDWVLCACVDGEIRILCYDYIMDDWDIHGRPNSCFRKSFVTHWMPMPEPPKGE